jgi:hypothetical protein
MVVVLISQIHLRTRHNYENLTDREILENKAMSSCRESIEWDHGDLKSILMGI